MFLFAGKRRLVASLTQIFDRPLRGREFFEEIIRDNLDLGRPDRVQLVFDRVVTKKPRPLRRGCQEQLSSASPNRGTWHARGL
jgi:hypothetical protein